MMKLRSAFLLAASLAAASACSGPSGPSAVVTTYQGTIASSAGQSGTLDISVQSAVAEASSGPLLHFARFVADALEPVAAAASAQASGTFRRIGGAVVALSGTYDSTTGAIQLSGGGYTFTLTVASGVVSGTFTGPGSGTGVVSALGSGGTVTRYCGTYVSHYSGEPSGGETGVWNLHIAANGTASGVAISTNVAGDPGAVLTGQLSGTTLTLTAHDLLSGHTNTTSTPITIQNGTFTMSFSQSGVSGTITGSTGACPH